MQKQCQKCRKKVSDELFICPHCGAIFGDPVYKPAPLPKKAKAPKEKKLQRSHSLAWIGPVFLILVMVCLTLILPKFLRQSVPDPETTTAVQTQPSNAPLVTYNVQVKAGDRSTMKGILIEIYLGDKMMDSCLTGLYGKASFTLPQNDNYRLRLKDLPKKYQINYGDTDFTFPDGQQDLVIELEKKPIPYIVKVVNEDGEPLPGAGVRFYESPTSSSQLITDKDGCCVFEAWYQETGYYVRFSYAPTGYAYILNVIHFDEGRNELVITLPTVKETVQEGEALYTVRVLDEYGQPVTDSQIYALTDMPSQTMIGSYSIAASGTLNQDGWFAFVGDANLEYLITLPQQLDYSDEFFRFEENTRELLIVLDLEREEYTYTVNVLDHNKQPLPGVEILLINPDGTNSDICLVSDENGVITFTSTEADPTKVSFILYEDDTHSSYRICTFPFSSRKLAVTVYHYSERRVYTIKVQDQNGQPVAGASLMVSHEKGKYYITSNEYGICTLRVRHYLYESEEYLVYIIDLPNGYTNPNGNPMPFEGDSREMTLTVISTAELAE